MFWMPLTAFSLKKTTIDIPTMFIQATKDDVLKPEMSIGMERYVTNLTRRAVDGHHWVSWEKPAEVNACVREWFSKCVFGRETKL